MRLVIAFDMDGVVLKSKWLKHQAMLDLFRSWPNHLQAIDQYNRAAGGVPRAEKIII